METQIAVASDKYDKYDSLIWEYYLKLNISLIIYIVMD